MPSIFTLKVIKQLTLTDVKQCLTWPAAALKELPEFNNGNLHVEVPVFHTEARPWTFVCCIRGTGSYAKPVLRGEWLSFVAKKDLHVGDKVIFYSNGASPRAYKIKIVPSGVPVRPIRLLGEDIV